MKNAIILLSGGLDSATCLAIASAQGFECYAISFDYGQRHRSELAAARRVAQYMEVQQHHVANISIGDFGGSALTDADIAVPDYAGDDAIPITYVPARNTVFLSMALGWAEVIDADAIYIGVSAVDYSGYPDCRPEYIDAFTTMANLATKRGVEGNPISIEAPLIDLDKAGTIRLGIQHGMDYSLTVSCYQADEQGRACSRCDSCYLRKKGFAEAGVADPTLYVIS